MQLDENEKKIILTGDRTTGQLHLGHYVGSLRNRVELQSSYKQFLLLADLQALTDNANDPKKVAANVREVTIDYLAVGIDPDITTICVQSCLPALTELTMIYLNYVTVSRLERNPTVKDEIRQRNFERDVPAGFLCYPVAQAADITAFKAELVPVGEDQSPMIEQTNEVVRRINRQCKDTILPEAKALIPKVGRLPSVDGKAKMSKSQGNAIVLSATSDEIRAAVKKMYTDPNHLRVSDPGQVEGNVVFTYLDAFDDDKEELQKLKSEYKSGGVADSLIKKRLEEILNSKLDPIRKRREELSNNIDYISEVLRKGTEHSIEVSNATLLQIKEALGLFSFKNI